MFAHKTLNKLQRIRACNLPVRGYAEGVATGINILKTGSDPSYKPANEYPEWLKDLSAPPQTLYELQRKMETKGEESITFEEAQTVVKLANRSKIKEKNMSKTKT